MQSFWWLSVLLLVLIMSLQQRVTSFTRSFVDASTPLRRCVHHHGTKLYSGSYTMRTLLLDDHGDTRGVTYVDEGKCSGSSPPIVILGGTAQTINTFTLHIKPLAKLTRVIVVELRGQGSTDLKSEHASMKQHVSDVRSILSALGLRSANLAGFSFGGRVALAFAAHHPTFVNKLSLTGVCHTRPKLGELIIRSWADALQRGNLRECAWSFVINGYSNGFIEHYHAKLPSFVDMVVSGNDPRKLHDLIRLSHSTDEGDAPFAISTCTPKVQCPTQVIAAAEDRIAGYQATLDLAQRISSCTSTVSMQAGHLAPFEQPLVWRKAVSDFFLS